MEAIAMVLIRLLGRIYRWYHNNDEIYYSAAYRRQRAQDKIDYYAKVWDPTNG
jgi:hypothetical protein